MVILMHGTGDDDSKAEQWMPWVAKVLRQYGEHVLVVPGVASSQRDQIEGRAIR